MSKRLLNRRPAGDVRSRTWSGIEFASWRAMTIPNIQPAIGDVIAGRYLIDDVVACRTTGSVVFAEDRDLYRRVAIKILNDGGAGCPVLRARFLREARIAAHLGGKRFPQVFDVQHTNSGALFIVMEAFEGRDMRDVLETRGWLPAAQAARAVIGAAEALRYAHEAGVVHRDIKPENLFIAWEPEGHAEVKVLDFGIAKLQRSQDELSLLTHDDQAMLGTVPYMAPEQIRSPSCTDVRADVWSLGVVLYELLTGLMPFGADQIARIIPRIVTQRQAPASSVRPRIPRSIDDVIGRCLAKNRDYRYQSVEALIDALIPFVGSAELERLLDEEEIPGRNEVPTLPSPRAA